MTTAQPTKCKFCSRKPTFSCVGIALCYWHAKVYKGPHGEVPTKMINIQQGPVK